MSNEMKDWLRENSLEEKAKEELMGDLRLLYDLVDMPDLYHALLDRCSEEEASRRMDRIHAFFRKGDYDAHA